MKIIITSIKILIVFTLITGIVYPGLIWIVAQTLYPFQANGSLVYHNQKIVGSRLIGQTFNSDTNFHCRPSNTDYNTRPGSGSNLGATNKNYLETITKRHQENPQAPLDFITSSASGLDPDISYEAALSQIERVASARNIPLNQYTMLIGLLDKITESPTLGILGKKRVNVLALNCELRNNSYAP